MRYYIPSNVMSIAHRGYSSKYKANTMKAFKNVKNKGFNMIELDIQLCKTGEIIIYHDILIETRLIIDMTLKEIKKKKKSIPTLKEFFEHIDVSETPIYLDMKGCDKLAHHLLAFLKTYNVDIDQVLACSYNKKHLDFLRKNLPDLRVGLITHNTLTKKELDSFIDDIDVIVINWQMLDHETVKYCNEKRVPVLTYTVRCGFELKYIKNYDITGILSNIRLFRSNEGYGTRRYIYR